jgi:FAD/FMN-containing dehydrogenase/Fe-S oxidoreductase
VARLAGDLRAATRGEVRFSAGDRALYATDASNYRQVPIGVVIPRSIDDILTTLAVCRAHAAPVLGRGGGTSIAGQCCNEAVVIDTSKYLDGIIAIDGGSRTARVQPGLKLDHLRHATAARGLTFGPDPGTHRSCTLGGMIGNNSCGVRSMLSEYYGPGPTTAHNIDTLDIVTYRGLRMRVGPTSDSDYRRIIDAGGPIADIYRQLKEFQTRHADLIRREFPDIPRRVSGYNLPALLPENGFNVARALVGSESTLVFVLEATAHLVHHFAHRELVVLGYPDIFHAADAVMPILEHRPIGLEGVDEMLEHAARRGGVPEENLRLLPAGHGWLLVEFGGDTRADAREAAHALVDRLRRASPAPTTRIIDGSEDQERIWALREMGGPAIPASRHERPMWPGWDDSAVAPEKLGGYLRDLHALYAQYEYEADLFGHFGQGCVHCRVGFDLETRDGVRRFRSFMEEAADLVHSYGGSLSGEHGDGQARGELLSRMFSPTMVQAFREFKAIWDPDWKMNPGKVVDANPLDANLRVGPGHYHPIPVRTHFTFADDGGFANAARRCVGIGNCRKDQAGTMCPSYMVTREEQHTTRGRARLLFEMLEGEPLDRGWDNEHVHEALDLCLSCKGCKGECPVHVDMATYKAEFLSHYYEHHWRPRSAYAFGLIHTWAGLAARAPRVVNALTQSRGLSAIAKFAAGMPRARSIPRFAPFTFREWFLQRSSSRPRTGHRVILWADTFNNHFHPETAIAAVSVLERLGFDVEIPTARLCCGRPLYDYGMLSAARRTLDTILQSLDREIDAGVPIVGLEPSCVAVFRDELVNLFSNDFRARRLSAQVFSLGEFLSTHLDRLLPTTLSGKIRALVHGHCHQKALFGMEGDRHVLDRLGVDYQMVDSGCCGMAGSFGFERDHYEVSQAVGERRLLPAVRAASPVTVIVADGFSCREQITQATGRHALHLAEVVAMAAHAAPADHEPSRGSRARTVGTAAIGVAVLLLAVRATLLRLRLRRAGRNAARPSSAGQAVRGRRTAPADSVPVACGRMRPDARRSFFRALKMQGPSSAGPSTP